MREVSGCRLRLSIVLPHPSAKQCRQRRGKPLGRGSRRSVIRRKGQWIGKRAVRSSPFALPHELDVGRRRFKNPRLARKQGEPGAPGAGSRPTGRGPGSPGRHEPKAGSKNSRHLASLGGTRPATTRTRVLKPVAQKGSGDASRKSLKTGGQKWSPALSLNIWLSGTPPTHPEHDNQFMQLPSRSVGASGDQLYAAEESPPSEEAGAGHPS